MAWAYHAYLTEEEEASWLEGFRDAGENGGILDVGKIQTAFEEKVGRKVAKSTVYDLLHRHGWRKITPRPRHPKSDPDAAASFKPGNAGDLNGRRAGKGAGALRQRVAGAEIQFEDGRMGLQAREDQRPDLGAAAQLPRPVQVPRERGDGAGPPETV